ncbi:unnamed protein product, partial [Choristocarpus tenellus]
MYRPDTLRHVRGYKFKAGEYAYINCPMISRTQWHPFSLIKASSSTEEH